ncbi:acetate kinase [Loktanella sp. D2R18]|uniref:acetate/propionate family kinase n=1 Tax=Rhodobacterales TaxID=204455 RepID=UPI000DE8E5DC|nr:MULTISPECIES: acetate/propionate family kinase [Rhodobacterales]MDO6589869.1 acetate/propionate family kinase [Yoonia sp. 1_MG-2023]RBW45978.1 acetate kinase [Loktanella sp. D2R18]
MSGILTLNAGSSSLKFGLYEHADEPVLLVHGQIDGIGQKAQLILHHGEMKVCDQVEAQTQHDALQSVMNALAPHMRGIHITGVGHRVVHGGPDFAAPVVLTPTVQRALAEFSPLAPLHQPHNLAGVTAAHDVFPDAIQVACFDTAFHRGHPWVNDAFAIPSNLYDEGIRRYGFHGLSYDYVTDVIARDFPELHAGRMIVAHLGNGASMCAIRGGRSVGSTMGFSALDGLPMGTRCGQIDPGVVLHLMEQKGMTSQDVLTLLYKQSGLLGLSGISGDMRTLLQSDTAEAKRAIDYYVFRARREIGALTAVLGGLDGLVFCGGIGENAGIIRERITEGLDYLGLTINGTRHPDPRDIGSGPTRILVIPTDEERVIARAVRSRSDLTADTAFG